MSHLFGVFLLLTSLIIGNAVHADSEEEFADDGITIVSTRGLSANWFFAPDLLIKNISYPQATGNGGFVVRVSVVNIGKTNAPPSNLLFRDNNFQSSQFRQVGTLGVNQTATYSFNISPPENQGPWYFSAVADYGNAVRERNETNNVKNFYQN